MGVHLKKQKDEPPSSLGPEPRAWLSTCPPARAVTMRTWQASEAWRVKNRWIGPPNLRGWNKLVPTLFCSLFQRLEGYQLFSLAYFSRGNLLTKKEVRKGTTGGPRLVTPKWVARLGNAYHGLTKTCGVPDGVLLNPCGPGCSWEHRPDDTGLCSDPLLQARLLASGGVEAPTKS